MEQIILLNTLGFAFQGVKFQGIFLHVLSYFFFNGFMPFGGHLNLYSLSRVPLVDGQPYEFVYKKQPIGTIILVYNLVISRFNWIIYISDI